MLGFCAEVWVRGAAGAGTELVPAPHPPARRVLTMRVAPSPRLAWAECEGEVLGAFLLGLHEAGFMVLSLNCVRGTFGC